MFLSSCSAIDASSKHGYSGEMTIDKQAIAVEMRRVLDDELERWYPLSIDTTCGGFFSDINEQWELDGKQDKMIVTQARHVWSAAHAAMFYQKDNALRNVAAHGLRFLKTKMWDQQFGGYYTLVDRRGEPLKEMVVKRADGNAYAIYGLATYYRASGDTVALKMAQETFEWLEKHSYDPQYGGYFQYMSQDGIALRNGFNGAPPKDQNSSIHLLECLTELSRVWPDPKLRDRLHSLLQIIRDRIATERGYMILSFTRDWNPVSYRDSSADVREKNYEFDHVSFGHDVETAYLMLEASEALGLHNDTSTVNVAKKMIDHALEHGWDRERGGLYDGGYYFAGEKKPRIVRNTKEWWSQAEALNALLMMSDRFPDDGHRYYEKFCTQWEYCKKYLIDNERGGWYWGGTDMVPGNTHFPKSSIWKCNYHTSRALINCINRLKHGTLTNGQSHFAPVNLHATPEARKLLEYLYSISGKKIIAGYHNYIQTTDADARRVKELTGKLPALWGCDFIDYYRSERNADSVIQEAYKKYNEGYMITLMWHEGRPKDDPPFGWKESIQGKLTNHEWQELITRGTPLNIRWQQQVDIVAGYLKRLQNLGVPVLWRPYHELNGVWFWWGNRKGENGSAKLYRMMFDRYVNYHKLNNLIWVWNTNAPRQLIDDEAYAFEECFPGLEYVDVLATDIYHNDYRQSHHDQLVELAKGKPIALGEIGEVPTPEMLSQQPLWAWFMMWPGLVDTHNTPQQIRDIYNNPKIVTHEDLLRTR